MTTKISKTSTPQRTQRPNARLLRQYAEQKERTQDRRSASQIALKWLIDAPMVVDVATTGLAARDRVVEIACVNAQGETMFHSLINPGIRIPGEAIEIHGIADEHVADAPFMVEVWPTVLQLLQQHNQIPAYNAAFEQRMLQQSLPPRFAAKLPDRPTQSTITGLPWQCLMNLYSQYHGQTYRAAYNRNGYIWQRLDLALSQCGLEATPPFRRAESNARAEMSLLRHIAENPEPGDRRAA